MQAQPLEEFSQRVAYDFAKACDLSPPGQDCFGTAYDYGKEKKTYLVRAILKLAKESDMPKKQLIKEIKAVASHMNALSYVYLVAGDLAENALED